MGEHKFRMADGETGSDLRAKGLMALPRRYGLAGVFRMAVSLLATKVISRDARLIRLPVYIRNRRLIRFGPGFTSGVGLRIEALDERSDRPLIEIGPNVQVNDYVHIGAVHSVRLGANVLIASKVFISDHNHGRYAGEGRHDGPGLAPIERGLSFSPVSIEDNVWIGEFVCVLPGVTIGRGAIIGAMSVVTCDIPPDTIAVGSPARPIKTYDPSTNRWEKA
jgi:acetyltransferase-like isoleucine patch superfamily enzyme